MAGFYPIDWPNSTQGGYWFRKMSSSIVTRTSDNSTDATEQALDTCLIPAGVCTTSSIIRIWSIWGISNNSSTGTTKTIALRMDTNPISTPPSGGTAILTSNQTTNTSMTLTGQVQFNNSLAAQSMYNGNTGLGGASGTNAVLTRTVDFSVDRNITFCASWAINQAVSQTITLNGWIVEVFR